MTDVLARVYCVECGATAEVVDDTREHTSLPDEWRRFLIEDAACHECWGSLDILPAELGSR